MLTFILASGLLIMVGAAWYTYWLISRSDKEPPASAEINNLGDLKFASRHPQSNINYVYVSYASSNVSNCADGGTGGGCSS